MNRTLFAKAKSSLFVALVLLLALSLVQCGSSATSPDDESSGQGEFPIGVYFVRGQKPIFDEGSETDFRADPEQARADYAREFGDLAAEGFNAAVMSVDPIAFGDHYREVLSVLLDEAQKNGVKLILPLGHVQGLLGELRDELSDADLYQAAAQDYLEYFKNSPACWATSSSTNRYPRASQGPTARWSSPNSWVRRALSSRRPTRGRMRYLPGPT